MTQFDSAKAAYTVEAASKVYYAKHSKKYHRTKHCRTLARSKHIYKCSKKKAKKMGLKKCKVCWWNDYRDKGAVSKGMASVLS